mmetsp:Transcript_49349/g.84389  ORF Transcript_49349/g.84389 Transcript_49349/m.84389 type:complete len:116 (+) Transcript_49349:137-484(+)
MTRGVKRGFSRSRRRALAEIDATILSTLATKARAVASGRPLSKPKKRNTMRLGRCRFRIRRHGDESDGDNDIVEEEEEEEEERGHEVVVAIESLLWSKAAVKVVLFAKVAAYRKT